MSVPLLITKSFADLSTSIFMSFSSNLVFIFSSIMSTICINSFSVSLWNTIISSIRFINSGLNVFLTSAITSFLISSYSFFSACSFSSPPENPNAFLSVISLAPIFDVIIITQFLKFTVLPCESVSLPSSSICNSIFKTSGCAFSISSNSITEYGFLLIFSVKPPPSSNPT